MAIKARIAVTDDGRVAMWVDEGNFQEGKKIIEKMMTDLAASGIQFDVIAPVEQHRHDHEHVEVNHAQKTS
jgi:hypothetical protein